MRHVIMAAVAAALAAGATLTGLTGCGSTTSTRSTTSTTASSSGSSTGSSTSASNCANSAIQGELFSKGVLTVATDQPAYSPWFASNQPSNGQGYESAVAYSVASQLGFGKNEVKWAYEPFDSSYAPGPKKFDFDINEVSVTPQRSQAVCRSPTATTTCSRPWSRSRTARSSPSIHRKT